jgi:hypothetical protein
MKKILSTLVLSLVATVMAYFNRAMSKLHTQDLEGSKKDNRKAEELGFDEDGVEQLDEWIETVEEIGYDAFNEQWE